jgi:hypothetical protein
MPENKAAAAPVSNGGEEARTVLWMYYLYVFVQL